jgi:hypothetical protein
VETAKGRDPILVSKHVSYTIHPEMASKRLEINGGHTSNFVPLSFKAKALSNPSYTLEEFQAQAVAFYSIFCRR